MPTAEKNADAASAPSMIGMLKTAIDKALAADGPAICAFYAPDKGVDFTSLADGGRSFGTALVRDTPFRIASVTKVYTAAAIFRLWELGRLSLEQPLSALASEETLSILKTGGYVVDAIVVKSLLAHTSGVYDHCHDPVFLSAVAAAPQKRWTRSEQLRFAVEHGAPYGPPGAQQRYSDTGYILLGEIIERSSGMPLGAAFRSLLGLDELGLTATQMEDDAYCAAGAASLFHGRFNGEPARELHPSFDLYGGGGLVSTARETALFIRALLTGAVFKRPQTIAAALSIPAFPIDPVLGRIRSYLLYRTEFLGRECWGHTGFWGNETLYCPSLDLAVTLSVFDGAEAGRNRRQNLRSSIETAAAPMIAAFGLS